LTEEGALMGVPSHFDVDATLHGSLGSVGPVTVGGSLGSVGPVSIAGIPDTYHINIDKLPKIQLGVDPVTLHLDPIQLSLSVKELPSLRIHQPMNFSVGLSLMGMELVCVRLCGESQMISEPYVPNPCEHCSAPQLTPTPVPGTVTPANQVPGQTGAGGGGGA
jgi:hypothetical protein